MHEDDRDGARVALVTGGSAGIGLAAAHRLARDGFDVVITGRDREQLERVCAGHASLSHTTADVRDPAACDRAVAETVARHGRLDILVNNAGRILVASLANAAHDDVADLFATNVLGPTAMARAALPHLVATQGAILNVSSSWGQKPSAGIAHYAASKAALESLTRSWALEFAPQSVRVNAVASGPVPTTVLRRAGLTEDQAEARLREMAERVPLGRLGGAEEVAEWLATLAGAPWVTGAVINVDGGLAIS